MPRYMFRTLAVFIGLLAFGITLVRAEPLPAPDELIRQIGSQPMRVEVYEPHMSTMQSRMKRAYTAYPFEVVADFVLGPEWRNSSATVEFRALDGYVSRIPVADFSAHRAHLAVGMADGGPFIVDNLRQNETDIELGPYYLIWENIDDEQVFARGASGWPYQVSHLLLIKMSDKPLRPDGLDPALQPAIELVKQHCLTCHMLNGYGGNKAPGDLAALARTLEDDTFRALVLDPRSVQAESTMPALSPDLPEQERNRIVKLLRAYLLQMPGDG